MARDKGKMLARIHRVRTLQLGMVRAEEVRAHDRFDSESTLKLRISQLADSVAPAPDATEGFSLVAAAHFRERLHRSAEAAEARLHAARLVADRAAEATRDAKRDQTAIEKLIARADAEDALRAIRALEAAPPTRKVRHDPC